MTRAQAKTQSGPRKKRPGTPAKLVSELLKGRNGQPPIPAHRVRKLSFRQLTAVLKTGAVPVHARTGADG
jgi:hypothetical protein